MDPLSADLDSDVYMSALIVRMCTKVFFTVHIELFPSFSIEEYNQNCAATFWCSWRDAQIEICIKKHAILNSKTNRLENYNWNRDAKVIDNNCIRECFEPIVGQSSSQ